MQGQRQTQEFAADWRDHGHPVTQFALTGYNHFDVQQMLSRANSDAIRGTLNTMGLN